MNSWSQDMCHKLYPFYYLGSKSWASFNTLAHQRSMNILRFTELGSVAGIWTQNPPSLTLNTRGWPVLNEWKRTEATLLIQNDAGVIKLFFDSWLVPGLIHFSDSGPIAFDCVAADTFSFHSVVTKNSWLLTLLVNFSCPGGVVNAFDFKSSAHGFESCSKILDLIFTRMLLCCFTNVN